MNGGNLYDRKRGFSRVPHLIKSLDNKKKTELWFPAAVLLRLEHSAEQEEPPVAQQASEGDLQDVRHLGRRHPQHPQCLSGCYGAPGILCHHAR